MSDLEDIPADFSSPAPTPRKGVVGVVILGALYAAAIVAVPLIFIHLF